MSGDVPNRVAVQALAALDAALTAQDATAVAKCFFPLQAFWRDVLALTCHIRTFAGAADDVAASLVETTKLRGFNAGLKLSGTAQFIPATPALVSIYLFGVGGTLSRRSSQLTRSLRIQQFIDFDYTFRTGSPAATCRGLIKLLPVKTRLDNGTEAVDWKIWTMSTILDTLDIHPENEALLQGPRKNLAGPSLTTDVVIIGGGNSAVTLSARLKALGVESIMVERNPQPGDNWKLRYDCMKCKCPEALCRSAYPY